MITVEQALMTRIAGDTTLPGNLQTLLGGANRIFHALEHYTPIVGMLTYHNPTNTPGGAGGIRGDNVESRVEMYVFNIFHPQYEVVADRLYRLLHQYRFPTPSDAGIKSCVWDWDGPDEFDELLNVGVKRVRYKLEVVRSAQSPI